MVHTIFYNFGRLWEITPEQSIRVVILAPDTPTSSLYNLTKFHENSTKVIEVIGRTRFRLQTDGQMNARAITIDKNEVFFLKVKRILMSNT